MMNKVFSLIVLVCASLYGLNHYTYLDEQRFLDQLQNKFESGQTEFLLSDITDFEWDTVAIVNPYDNSFPGEGLIETSKKAGWSYEFYHTLFFPKDPLFVIGDVSEYVTGFIFVKDNKVVRIFRFAQGGIHIKEVPHKFYIERVFESSDVLEADYERSKDLKLSLRNQKRNYVIFHGVGKEAEKMNKENISRIKLPTKNANVSMFIQALTERVWISKYYGTPSEILEFNLSMPFCEKWPDEVQDNLKDTKKFLWDYKCVPVEIKSQKMNDDLSGVFIIRMLNFGRSREIIDEVFNIANTNNFHSYRLEEYKISQIKKLINKKLNSKNSILPINYDDKFKTYSKLENFYFLEGGILEDDKLVKQHAELMSELGRKYALQLSLTEADSNKNSDVIEFKLNAPPGFFGYENIKQFEGEDL